MTSRNRSILNLETKYSSHTKKVPTTKQKHTLFPLLTPMLDYSLPLQLKIFQNRLIGKIVYIQFLGHYNS